jgi:hypothetical protein
MKIVEIANSIDHRYIIRKIMMDKKWPAGLVKEIEDEWIMSNPTAGKDAVEYVNNLILVKPTPVKIPVVTLLTHNDNIRQMKNLPQDILDKIKQNHPNAPIPGGTNKNFEKNPKRYDQYSKMDPSTAMPSVMVDGAIDFGVGRFTAALVRGDQHLNVWQLQTKK